MRLPAGGRCADIGEQPVVVAGRRAQVRVDVRHQRVVEHDADVEVGDPRVAGHGDRRADEARPRSDGLRDVRAGIGRCS